MQNTLTCLLILALLCAAACNNPGIHSFERAEDQPAKHAAQESELRAKGLTRVGDSPPFDSPSLAIQCVDEQTCWINSPRILWQSLDGGKSWQEINRAPKDQDIQSFDFIDDETGWLIRLDKLYRSEDGGRTWTYRASPLQNL